VIPQGTYSFRLQCYRPLETITAVITLAWASLYGTVDWSSTVVALRTNTGDK
jgi:hypothetical protein